MLVFILFPFYSLRPIARLGQEAVDEAVERSESWFLVERFMFICPYQTRAL
jgi:hypothetical protein